MLDLIQQRLQRRLGYEFRDAALLDLALTHRSHGARNNERLEFLGDSILNFVIGEALFRRFPEAREGQLSRLRSQMVKGETLAALARELELGECLRLGEGEMKSGGHRRESILADTVEALIGAMYQEAGFERCAEQVRAWYQTRLDGLSLEAPAKDAKTRLQEFLQAHQLPLPEYVVVEVEGEAHAHRFTIECRVSSLKEVARAQASSRRVAEKQAAAEVLEKLQKLPLKNGRKRTS
ncbi:ribonuclease III [Marinimicrobium sp. ARAG 43.8]|uniref:ribonuclease III n=1 Tax=Marinimicrobium sp. ARAG 43.8 TaxID=3418719 RepID=UPI003CF8C83A